MLRRTISALTLFALTLLVATPGWAAPDNPFDLDGSGEVTIDDFDFTDLDPLDNPYNLNGDGGLSTADLTFFLGLYGTSDPSADVNCDGTVDGWDLRAFLHAIYTVGG